MDDQTTFHKITRKWCALPTLMSSGQPFFFAAAPTSEMGLAKSGVNGPLMWGSSCEQYKIEYNSKPTCSGCPVYLEDIKGLLIFVFFFFCVENRRWTTFASQAYALIKKCTRTRSERNPRIYDWELKQWLTDRQTSSELVYTGIKNGRQIDKLKRYLLPCQDRFRWLDHSCIRSLVSAGQCELHPLLPRYLHM